MAAIPRVGKAALEAGGVADYDEVERELKMARRRADSEDKAVDTAYKQMLARYEPTKLIISVGVAVAAVFGTVFGVFGYILGRGH